MADIRFNMSVDYKEKPDLSIRQIAQTPLQALVLFGKIIGELDNFDVALEGNVIIHLREK